jgi:hypothetical protein
MLEVIDHDYETSTHSVVAHNRNDPGATKRLPDRIILAASKKWTFRPAIASAI